MEMATSNNSTSRNPWTHFNCKSWVTTVLVYTLVEIIAAVVVLAVSRDAKPDTPLVAWVLVYMAVCVATLPHIYWKWHETGLFITSASTDIFAKPLLVFFYNVSLVVGCVVIPIYSSHAPILFWSYVVYLTIGFYLWILWLCYHLKCVIYLVRVRNSLKDGTQEYINALPMRKFRSKNNATSGDGEACCICLTKYVDGDKLRELVPCSHLFHTVCVDKRLKKNDSCPLCRDRTGILVHKKYRWIRELEGL